MYLPKSSNAVFEPVFNEERQKGVDRIRFAALNLLSWFSLPPSKFQMVFDDRSASSTGLLLDDRLRTLKFL